MIGCRSVQHQGYLAARTGKADEDNSYPKGCQAFYEYQDGCNAFRRGDVIDRRGLIAVPGAATLRRPNETNFRQGASW